MTRVLVIDDDIHVRAAMRVLLELDGIDTVLAERAQDGADALGSSTFDMIFVDIFMPGMDGLKAIKAFRERAPTVPIVAMSGFVPRSSIGAGVDFLGMAASLGAAYCLKKPFQRGELITAIETCLGDSCRRSSFCQGVTASPVRATHSSGAPHAPFRKH